uniref:FBD domain-containing protein n=1 Tax=Oryza brachyantha TaxID=4533 RepID=J3NDT8_ORYBR
MDHLELELVVDMPFSVGITEIEWPMAIGEDNDIPELPNVTNLELTVDFMSGGHAIGATLAKLISKCKKLQNLSITIDINDDYEEEYGDIENCSNSSCFCRRPEGWEDMVAISLGHLRVVVIPGSTSVGDLTKLVQLLVASSPALVTMMDEYGTHIYGGEQRQPAAVCESRTSAQENEEDEAEDYGRERKRSKTMDGI